MLYAFVCFINYFYSQWGWRLLHCCFSLSVGYDAYDLTFRLIVFLFGYWIALELFCNKYLFPFDKYHQMGKEILLEILEEMEKEKM